MKKLDNNNLTFDSNHITFDISNANDINNHNDYVPLLLFKFIILKYLIILKSYWMYQCYIKYIVLMSHG